MGCRERRMISVRSAKACDGISTLDGREGQAAYDPTVYKWSVRPGIHICYATGGWVDIFSQLDAPEGDMDEDEKPNEPSGPSV